MFISKFMTREVVTLNRKMDISEARQLMGRYRIRHLPVIQPDNTLVGMVSDRDMRSALPSKFFECKMTAEEDQERATGVLVQDIMTKDPITISLSSTIQDVLLLLQKARVGAFPVLDEHHKLAGIVSDRDLLNAFVDVLGIREPGSLLGIVVDERGEEMERVIHALITENITFGSILVHRNWRPGKRAVFPYLLAKNVTHLKEKLRSMDYEVLDPVQWYLEGRD